MLFSVVLLTAVCFSPVLADQKTESRELMVEVHSPRGIDTGIRELSQGDYETVLSCLEDAGELLKQEYFTGLPVGGETRWKMLEKVLSTLYDHDLIPGDVFDDLRSNLLLLFFGYGTEMARMSLPFLFLYILYVLNSKFFERVTVLNAALENLLRFSLCRSRILIPFSVCAVWGKLEIFTFGFREAQYISREGKWRNQPDFLTLLGFTGIWISVANQNQAANSWFIGSALYMG